MSQTGLFGATKYNKRVLLTNDLAQDNPKDDLNGAKRLNGAQRLNDWNVSVCEAIDGATE
jgi:hypothetical protein